MNGPIWSWGLAELGTALAGRQVSSQEATLACLERIEATRRLGAWLEVDREGALGQARAADARLAAGAALGPLDGVPLAVKDNLLMLGTRTTCASRMLERFRSPFDAGAVRRLREAGAVLVGKLNMDEFAMGSSSELSAFGPVLNPWDAGRVAGGSSGGSAAAVAAASVFASLGSDTGGSIRQPAALCGVVGIKPTYGRVSRHGLVAYASSLDQVGPIARSVVDCALVLAAIAGPDPLDATCLPDAAPPFRPGSPAALGGRRLGVPREYLEQGADADVRAGVEGAIAALAAEGAEMVELSLPRTHQGIATYYVLAPAEASSNLARYDGVRYGHRAEAAGLYDMVAGSRSEGFGPEVQRRVLMGTFVLSARHFDAYFARAQRTRELLRADFRAAFAKVDALVTPTSPQLAPPLGAKDAPPEQRYLADAYTVGANLAGLPALTVPWTQSAGGLPMGVQLMGPAGAENLLFALGQHLERLRPHRAWRPPC